LVSIIDKNTFEIVDLRIEIECTTLSAEMRARANRRQIKIENATQHTLDNNQHINAVIIIATTTITTTTTITLSLARTHTPLQTKTTINKKTPKSAAKNKKKLRQTQQPTKQSSPYLPATSAHIASR
jgi:hypothetical protein